MNCLSIILWIGTPTPRIEFYSYNDPTKLHCLVIRRNIYPERKWHLEVSMTNKQGEIKIFYQSELHILISNLHLQIDVVGRVFRIWKQCDDGRTTVPQKWFKEVLETIPFRIACIRTLLFPEGEDKIVAWPALPWFVQRERSVQRHWMEEEAQSTNWIHVCIEATERPMQFENTASIENVMRRRCWHIGQMDNGDSHSKIWKIVVQQLSGAAGRFDEGRVGEIFVQSMRIYWQYHFIGSIAMW